MYVLASVIMIPAMNWVLLPITWEDLWTQFPLAVVYGLLTGLFRPKILVGGVAFLGVGAVGLYLGGHAHSIHEVPPQTWIVAAGYFMIGMMLGWAEVQRANDGD
jgi:hypothetical protein